MPPSPKTNKVNDANHEKYDVDLCILKVFRNLNFYEVQTTLNSNHRVDKQIFNIHY